MLASKHHPNGTQPPLENDRLEACIFRYQAQGDAESLTEILQLTRRRALALARFYHCGRYLPEAELLADVHIKLMHNISRFDPTRSSGFSYASRIISTALITAVSRVQKAADRYAELDEA